MYEPSTYFYPKPCQVCPRQNGGTALHCPLNLDLDHSIGWRREPEDTLRIFRLKNSPDVFPLRALNVVLSVLIRFSCTWRHYKYFFYLDASMDIAKVNLSINCKLLPS
jgi:hypothetical protein